tara:strand:+ start:2310 stop:2663 length:354 start_codon:yes stop_codon:yes gene_type:complete
MGWKQDPNDSSKMVPIVSNNTRPSATTPPTGEIQYRPAYVIVGNDRDGLFFNFSASGSQGDNCNSVSSTTDGTWVNFGTFPDGTRLDIAPMAWSGSNASTAAGDVIFVYDDKPGDTA